MTSQEIQHRFKFHPADTEHRQKRHETVRSLCLYLAENLNGLLPEGREKSLAITHLEETMMWANAAIARAE